MAYRTPVGPSPLASMRAGQGILGNWNPQYMDGVNQGILGGAALPPSSAVGSMPPTLPASAFPSFMTGDPDPSQVTGGAAAMAGNNGGLGPLTTGQKWQLALSGIQDATDTLQHRQGGNFNQTRSDILTQAQRGARAQAMSDFQSAQTPGDKQAALMRFWASDGDTAGLGAVLKSQNPELHGIGTNGLVGIDPTTGLPRFTIPGKPAEIKPIISNGMQSLDGGKTYTPIPGYVDQQRAIADVRRAPAKAKAPGALTIPHPSSMY